MKATDTATLGSIAKRMSGGAACAGGALTAAVILQRACGFPVFRDVGATVGLLLLIGIACVAVVARRRADPLWTLGALAALPVLRLLAYFVSDPALGVDASDFGMFVRGNVVIPPALFAGALVMCAVALVVRIFRTRANTLVIVGAVAMFLLSVGLSGSALFAPRPPRIEAWRAVEATLMRPNALHEARATVGDDPSRFASIDPGPLFDRAYVVRLPVSDDGAPEIEWRGPEGILGVIRGRVVEVERCLTRVPDDGLAVIFISGRGGLLWSQPWGPRRGNPCTLDGRVASLDRLPASRAGFGTGLGAPREAGWLAILAALIGGLGVYAAARGRGHAGWIESLDEATLVLIPDAFSAMARLPDGELIRLGGRMPTIGARVFVPRPLDRARSSYRVDPRPSVDEWLETKEPRDAVVASLRAHAAQLAALALVVMAWLATPAAFAVVAGFPVSVW